MTNRIFLFDAPDRFIVGTVGAPGERSFFLQARDRSRLVSVLVEKDQVAALVTRLGQLLRELKRSDPSFAYALSPRDDEPLEFPIDEEFRVGTISLSWLPERSLIALDFQAMPVTDPSELEIESSIDESELDVLRVIITPGVAGTFINRATAVISAGRPPCPFCGLALDPRGHVCPRANGYRR